MNERTAGIHHVTAISGDPQKTIDFYSRVLGLRLVKRTVNFDDPSTYHFYFGDETGTPGTVLTFFPFRQAGRGRVGNGQVSATAFVVPDGSIGYWHDRLDSAGVDVDSPVERCGEPVLPFRDGDGQPLELVAGRSSVDPWQDGPVPVEYAVRGFHGVSLLSTDPDRTGIVLETLGYELTKETTDRDRYLANGNRARVVDVLTVEDARPGYQGAGTVHHVAFRTENDETQSTWRERLAETGLAVTPQRDRQYFRSIYFREPGGILFEIATDGPGFTLDEDAESLGSSLKLPPWLEEDRSFLEPRLPDVDVGTPAGAD